LNKIWRKTSIVLLAVSMLFLISMFATVQARPILDLDGEFYFPIRYCGCADDPFILVIVKYQNGTYVHKATVEIYNSAGTLVRTGKTWYGLYLTWFRNHDTYTIKAFKDGLSAEMTLKTTRWFHCVTLVLEPTCTEVTITVLNETDQPQYPAHVYVYD